jgi:hypothetical protein
MLRCKQQTPHIVPKSRKQQLAGHAENIEDARNKFEIWDTKLEILSEKKALQGFLLEAERPSDF